MSERRILLRTAKRLAEDVDKSAGETRDVEFWFWALNFAIDGLTSVEADTAEATRVAESMAWAWTGGPQ